MWVKEDKVRGIILLNHNNNPLNVINNNEKTQENIGNESKNLDSSQC